MNIIQTGNSITIQAVIRECTPVTINNFMLEFIFPGGKRWYAGLSSVTYVDADSPVTFEGELLGGNLFVEGDQANVNIYHFPVTITEALLILIADLQLNPVADNLLSLKTKLTGYTFDLVYRGLIFCTAETVYYPYNPIDGEFTTIEKEAVNYKTR